MKNKIELAARNARFWTLENGSWVKLTIKPGAVLRWSKFTRDCEGWSFEANAWEHMGEYVQLDWLRRGADCDGRIERAGSCTAQVDELRAVRACGDELPAIGSALDAMNFRQHDGTWIMRPEWRELGAVRCHDEFAEAANY